jgi:signal transduction histidine kinase
MVDQNNGTVQLQPQELDAVYTLSQAVASAISTEAALDKIVKIARPIFIFDNIVLYEKLPENGLDPTYARAIGRGRFREADLAWGEVVANEAYQNGRTTTRFEELDGGSTDRTNIRHFLGLPLRLAGQSKGVLVFIRFGGPVFTPDQISLAEFIALHVAQILERKQLVNQIANLEAKRRLDSLQDDFIAMISHELLTPLGFIKGYATTLLREDTSWDESTRKEFLLIIDEESDRLRNLIDNLLDSSRLQAGTLQMAFQTVRLDTFLKELSLRVRSMHEDLRVDLELRSPGLQVSADPTRLTQVFDNIISNATKYAPGSPIKIILDKKNLQARISVQDYGPGIAAEHLDRIFQRFYRVQQSSTSIRGSGLGLYITRKIVQAHDGEIDAQSHLGLGTTFQIYLPLLQKPDIGQS